MYVHVRSCVPVRASAAVQQAAVPRSQRAHVRGALSQEEQIHQQTHAAGIPAPNRRSTISGMSSSPALHYHQWTRTFPMAAASL